MTDPYAISETPEATDRNRPAVTTEGMVRPVLWLVLIVSAAANALVSGIGLSAYVGAGFGLMTMACAIALIVHHYRHRRLR